MFRVYFKLSLLLLAFALSVFAQGGESTQILGIVEDTSGAIIPSVTVTVTHVATGQQRKVVTGESGNYVITNINPGEYTVRAEKGGFKSEIRSGLILQLNQKARVDMKLTVGAVTETVEVSARGVILNTDDATMGNVVEQKRITDLPLNGRNFANLAGLMPGVIKGISSNTNQYGRRDTAIAISANGMRENQGQVLRRVSTAWNINNATSLSVDRGDSGVQSHAGRIPPSMGCAGGTGGDPTRPGGNQLRGRSSNPAQRRVRCAQLLPPRRRRDILQRNQFGFVLSGPVWIPRSTTATRF
jgi:hypothetical protein